MVQLQKYQSVSGSDKELEDESADAGFEADIPPRKRRQKIWRYVHFIVDIALVFTVTALIWTVSSLMSRRSSCGIALGPHPGIPFRDVTFLPNLEYASARTFESESHLQETLHQWLDLTTYGRGIINVGDGRKYTSDPPLQSSRTDSAYMISVFHQLHCLSRLLQSYGELYLGLTPSVDAEHAAHCFDYLRQSIMCDADVTLEGNNSAGPGWGSTHVCKDFESIQRWGNEMAAPVRNDTGNL
ncbi:hypothetical protein NA57DRAFT_78771 [Rhizodiscina lignyota]|uniref:Oxidase ustYa n=1 Tax=Rhizodiscina lignyota TaxID=1504668 RepID=A0A9P4IB49_9PEZI|nr:hypothetical protein NA57DRAFT_78771 [Rhizodiscina lignyota]